MIYKTLAATAAISFALSSNAFSQDKVQPVTTETDQSTLPVTKKIQPIAGESQDKMMGSGGEDRLTENVSIAAPGSGAGKANFQDLSLAQEATGLKLGPIKGESQDKAMVDGGEDRLTENVVLGVKADSPKIGDVQGESQRKPDEGPACVTEDGALDADCNGVADDTKDTRFDRRDIRKRPEPRQQRR
ncbi:hypothetical protein [Litorimonas sp. WD9-15]|uniref:hypothetical protein n=1 Tax=Litorimonas sp. WD9-15 TaxID=3418716 RepID=UPI003D03DE9F